MDRANPEQPAKSIYNVASLPQSGSLLLLILSLCQLFFVSGEVSLTIGNVGHGVI
ncbi:TPA: hypothetical protein O4G41_004653 [Vibrio alginolyticus]|nr:hypothetical protein [Vibrio vulnificus]HCZ9047647.1 hypothetical protein [Vibrio alginolyticus]HCZ9302845.1 hypothetical protein [Vibrio alginolyticus]